MSDDHVSLGAFFMGISLFLLGGGIKELVVKDGNATLGFGLLGLWIVSFVIFAFIQIRARVSSDKPDNEGVTSNLPKNTWMWLFLSSEVVFFTMLIGLSFALRLTVDPKFGLTGIGAGWLGHVHDSLNLKYDGWVGNDNFSPEDLDIILTTVNTFLLIISSYTMVIAVEHAHKGEGRKASIFLLITAGIGATFLGIQISEYIALFNEGFDPSAGLFGATFFLQTGFHGAHVLVGILLLILMAVKGFMGGFDKPGNNDVEIVGLYWHFVDLVWVILFTLVYLL